MSKSELVRLVWNDDAGAVVLDASQVMPGRGCYLHPGCADQVARRKLVGRALRRPVDSAQVAAVLATSTASAASAAEGPA
jgi:predicted RNA-binding protein YlxR (DUF448 family)